MGVSGPGVETTERTHIDDAALCRAEMRQGFVRNEEGAASVGFEDLIPLGEGQALEGGGAKDSGVIDEDVEAAKGGSDHGDGIADGGFGTNIARDRERAAAEAGDRGGCASGFRFRGAIGDSDVGAGVSEGKRDGAAQAARASRNEDRFAGEWIDGRHWGLHKISLARQRS